ncbi:M20/M25/M40 family metallo-hydrolase [Acidipropionibacterium jensenii]|uniref:M20/M25/M40 family metallo-hydrolase n=1 Tax=Acidipropionibacterium jensenii TaxID=1749 RepID=UPI00214A9B67|nr:M20/M25/M40 family metallo-hydrolase [Acidipropionibacterium jensenii]
MTQPGSQTLVLARLEQLVRVESPSRDAAASRRITDLLAAWFAELGLVARRIQSASGVHLIIDDPGDGVGAPILLVGHSDTVWEHGDIETRVPWVHDGDVLRGPGALDMKSGLVMIISALEQLRGVAHRPVRVVITCDEESGSPTGEAICRQAAEGVAAAIGFECPHPDGALKVGRRGSTRLRVSVTGRAAHAALDPESGISAIDELVDQLVGVRGVIAEANRIKEVLCNVGIISGGSRANVIPDHAEAEIGLRFLEARSEAFVLDRLTSLTPIRAGARIDSEILTHRPTWAPKASDQDLLAEIAAAGAALGQMIEGRPAAGAGDTNLVGGPLGIPAVDGFGPMGGGAHAVSEHILVPTLFERLDLLVGFLRR